jgi:outer membrane receptor protein involved in Fe transport
MTPTVHRFPLVRKESRRLVRWLSQALLGVCLLCSLGAAEPPRNRFDISAGPAESTLKAYAAQSGREVIFSSATTRSVRTNPVVGSYSADEALEQLLKDTGLVATRDTASGTFSITRAPKAPRAAPDPGVARRPSEAATPAQGTGPKSALSNPAPADETVVLSPFEVRTDLDRGYAASSTLAGSRVRTELRDLAAPISVLTKDLLDDLAAVNLQEALAFAPGAENNFSSLDPSLGNGDNQHLNANANRIRGLSAAAATRNFFSTALRLDTYNSTRIDVSRGPNSILFGLGSPAGVINTTMDRAVFKHQAKVESRFDSEGSHRVNFAVNRNLIDRKLAVLVAGLHEQTQTWQKPTLDHQNRAYAAIQGRPFAQTSINASYENYWNYRQLPISTLSRDFVSAWIAAGRPAQTTWATAPLTPLNPAFVQYNSTAPVFVNGSLGPVPQFYSLGREIRSRGPHENLTGTDAFSLSLPPSVMPPDRNVTGAASFAEMSVRTFTASIEQRVGPNLTFELAFNHERSSRQKLDLASVGVTNVMADPNLVLSDGRANPNFGRYYFQDNPRGLAVEGASEALRLTGTYNLDLTRRSRWFGRHQFSVLGAQEKGESKANNGNREFISSEHTWLPAAARNNLFHGSRRLWRRFYLDDPFQPRGGNLQAVVDQLRFAGETPGPDGVPVISDPFRPGSTAGVRTKSETGSIAGVWQGYLWNNRIVTTFGWRRDRQEIFSNPGLTFGGTGPERNLFMPAAALTLPDQPTNQDAGNTATRGVAFHATSWLSLYYNESNSFSLGGGSRDLYNNIIPGSTGEGRDFGFGTRLLGDRLNVRVTRYETSQIGAGSNNFRQAVRFNFQYIEDAIAAAAGTPRDPNLAPPEAWTTMDYDAKGWEFEAVVNPTPRWRIAGNAAQQQAVQSNIALQARDYLKQRLPLWQRYFDVTAIGTQTIQQLYETGIKPTMDLAAASDGVANAIVSEWRWNLITNYDFAKEGPLRGFSVGGAIRWVAAPPIGYQNKIVDGQTVLDITKPWFGARTFSVDGSLRYAFRAFRTYPVRLQLNIRNLLGNDELAPVRVRSDRSGGVYVAPAPRLFVLSTSISL